MAAEVKTSPPKHCQPRAARFKPGSNGRSDQCFQEHRCQILRAGAGDGEALELQDNLLLHVWQDQGKLQLLRDQVWTHSSAYCSCYSSWGVEVSHNPSISSPRR